MFDVSSTEFLVILVVALLVFGPTRLPELARKVGGWMQEFRSAATELRRGLESEVRELHQPLQELKDELRDEGEKITGPLRSDAEAAASTVKWVGPTSPSGPSPEDAERDLEKIEQGDDPSDEGVDVGPAHADAGGAGAGGAGGGSAGAAHADASSADAGSTGPEATDEGAGNASDVGDESDVEGDGDGDRLIQEGGERDGGDDRDRPR